MNSIEKSEHIKRRYKEYLKSSFKFGSDKLQSMFEKQLENEDLFKGPYVALDMPFVRGKNINELMNENLICYSFSKLKGIDFDRPLYSHQEEALRHMESGRNAVITTGTGSGKTECFLYPILNTILREIENGNDSHGIRAIFLYPMNALINDQIDRVREMLVSCPEVTYGFFTGETRETESANYREKYESENGVHIPQNELVSREEMRKNPPHLLFTNYSMLEYILLRPNDYSMFNQERLDNWKYVVLDEAHTYYGSLGIEISMLLRRLTGVAKKKPQFILTSATLGEKGKSENEIVKFAHKLTASDYTENDIIFSKRYTMDKSILKYSVKGEDYSKILDNLNNMETVGKVLEAYNVPYTGDVESCIYDLLIGDVNVYSLYELLKEKCKSFAEISTEFIGRVSEGQLVALIDLINKASRNGVELFTLKYHSFVRPLVGAYVSLGTEPQLSLTKTNVIDEMKAFEIGNCKYCNSPYIIGRIQHSSETDLDYLLQNKEVDIYENYGENAYARLDYFLLDNLINEEEVEKDTLKKCILCSKCGCITDKENLNAKICECGEKYHRFIYKVEKGKNDKIETTNNIRQCPCCGHGSASGIVASLNLGKDMGTALIAEFLLEAMEDGKTETTVTKKISLKAREKEVVSKDKYVKQFLSFSDSRQQASFAAAFFDATYTRTLQKRLIWDVIEKNNYRDISVDEMAAILTSVIKERQLFADGLNAHKNAWSAILVSLLKVDGSYDGEGLGLYYFDLDLRDIMNQIEESDVNQEFGKYSITKKDLETMMQVVLGVFKITPAISYAKATLTPKEKMDMLEYRRFDNYVMYNCPGTIKGVRSFLPVKSKDNMVVRYVQKAVGCGVDKAKEILDIIFNSLAVEGNLLKKHDLREAYQIDVSKYIIKNYKTSKYYKCSKCGRLTPYNVHNVCVQDNCDGILTETNPDEDLVANYYRNQYKSKKIEKVVIEEHTAQIDRKKAKEYQQEFKKGNINILSCSTTFEMGIDLGRLETVFMRNVPPSPANYVQRAGRAGRRKGSSAYILTYCGVGSHDYTYFCEPEKMISGIIQPPYFDVANNKIIKRHLMASCLGYFFRKKPEYCANLDKLVFGNGVEDFKNYVLSHPKDLSDYINDKVLPEEKYKEYHNFKWFDNMHGNDEKLENFVDTVKSIVNEYEKGKKEALQEENYKEADYYTRQISAIHKMRVIDSLSKYCVIPKYGFPVDVVSLQTYDDGKLEYDKDLSRDLKIAISEYAPDSEVIVNKKKYTSKYVTLPKSGEFPRHYFKLCPKCRRINVFLTRGNDDECRYCGENICDKQMEYYIEPVNGFKTGVTKESTRMKPKRSYASEVSYIGGGSKDERHLEMGNGIIVETSVNDELLVVNKSVFYMCNECGYAEIPKISTGVPNLKKSHRNYRRYECSSEELVRTRLGHNFQTDVARLTIPSLEVHGKEDYAVALSFLYALLEGISIALQIERKDIDGLLEFNSECSSYDVLIYDNVPGGAGHVKRLVNENDVVNSLKCAYDKVAKKCCDENTSCYNCLRNYYNQSYHSKLQRKYAKDFVGKLMCEIGCN
jgi:hypothetical protein